MRQLLGRSLSLICASSGALFLGWKAFSLLGFIFDVFVSNGTSLRKYGDRGSWAVVTGASDGLGKEFATQLAAKGFNVVLVSRTKSKLVALAEELERQNPGVQTQVLVMDFSDDDDKDYERLAALVSGLDVAILINNVGQSQSMPTPFLQTDTQEVRRIVNVNCLGTLKTTAVVAPILQKRKRGLILTMGSLGGWTPIPYVATYCGSKAFLQCWSSALAQELKADGVDVQLIVSYLVATSMTKAWGKSTMMPGAQEFVRAALQKIGTGGWMDIAYTYTPWWSHALMTWAVGNSFGAGNAFTILYNFRAQRDFRQKALQSANNDANKL